MDTFREEIGYDAEEFKRITQETVLERGFSVGGEEYKRSIPNELGEYYQQWIQRKGVYVETERKLDDILYSPQLADRIREDFMALEWLYNFFKECVML